MKAATGQKTLPGMKQPPKLNPTERAILRVLDRHRPMGADKVADALQGSWARHVVRDQLKLMHETGKVQHNQLGYYRQELEAM